jgi:hypothetical protein
MLRILGAFILYEEEKRKWKKRIGKSIQALPAITSAMTFYK